MVKCSYQRVKKKVLCVSDVNKQILIKSRVQNTPKIGEVESSENFETYGRPYSAVKTLRGTQRFDSINIDEKATHLFYIYWADKYENLEVNNYFIEYKDKYYDILEIDVHNENREFLIIQATERGDKTLEASQA